MKTKLCLLAAVVLLLGLLAHSHLQAIKLQESLDFQIASIKAIAMGQAKVDLSGGVASYVLTGRIETAYVAGLEAQLQPYNIRTKAVGCDVTEAYRIYSDEYNRIVRESLVALHGRDLIREHDVAWSGRAR